MAQDPQKLKSLAVEQINRFMALEGKRKAERDDDFQFIAALALPQDSNITTSKTEGVTGYTQQIYETTLIQSMETLASGLSNWWTPQNQGWAEYGVPEALQEENKVGIDDATKWLGKASDKAMKVRGRSNFYSVKATGDLGLAVFATDLIIADESDTGQELLNFIHVKIGTYVIEENYKGIVDTARRRFKMTYRQIQQKFAAMGDNIPEKMVKAASGKNGPQKEFEILHCIFPREDSERLPGRRDGPNKPVASVYISLDFKETLRVSGYDETPILCRRFKKWVTVWGYGPGYLALPDARQINYMQQNIDAAAELHINPRVLIPSNLEGDVDLRAGGATIYDENMEGAVPREWATVSDYKLGLDVLAQKRQQIKDACYVDAFKLLNSAPLLDKEMTAYEISQRQAEQLQNMTAVNARTVVEFINPLMARVFGAMMRAGTIKNPPEVLLKEIGPGKKGISMPEIVVTSRFNDALRALKNRAYQGLASFLLPLSEKIPSILDPYDWDKVSKDYGDNEGVAPDSKRPEKGPKSVDAIRQIRIKQQEQARAAQMAESLGKAGAGLGKSPDFVQDKAKEQMGG